MSTPAAEAITSSNSYCAQKATRSSTLRNESRRRLESPREVQWTCPELSIVYTISEHRLAAVEGFGGRLGRHALHSPDPRHRAEQVRREPLLAGLAGEVAGPPGGPSLRCWRGQRGGENMPGADPGRPL